MISVCIGDSVPPHHEARRRLASVQTGCSLPKLWILSFVSGATEVPAPHACICVSLGELCRPPSRLAKMVTSAYYYLQSAAFFDCILSLRVGGQAQDQTNLIEDAKETLGSDFLDQLRTFQEKDEN